MNHSSSSEEDSDSGPVLWNAPKPAVKEVTEQQKRDFEKTFASVKSQLNDVLNQQQQVKAQHKKLKKQAQDLVSERKQVDDELKSCIQETEDIQSALNQKKKIKQKSNPQLDFMTQKEMLEISSINTNISDIKTKINKLKTQYSEEQKLWKAEKNRLVRLLKEQKNESEIMVQSIRQFKDILREHNISDNIDFDIHEESDSDILKSSSSSEEIKPKEKSSTAKKLIDNTIQNIYNENINTLKNNQSSKTENEDNDISDDYESDNFNVVSNSRKYDDINSPLKIVPNPKSKLVQMLSSSSQSSPMSSPIRSSPPPKPQVFKMEKVRDFMPSIYKLDFTYKPRGQPKTVTTIKNGTEIIYENGDKYIEYRNGTKKIRRQDGTSYIMFSNDDVSKEFPDGAVAYYFGETRAIQLTLPDQTIHTVFSNGQKEINFTNGDKYTVFPDQSTKYTKKNGDFQVHLPNGKVQTCINGNITII